MEITHFYFIFIFVIYIFIFECSSRIKIEVESVNQASELNLVTSSMLHSIAFRSLNKSFSNVHVRPCPHRTENTKLGCCHIDPREVIV